VETDKCTEYNQNRIITLAMENTFLHCQEPENAPLSYLFSDQ